MFPERAPEPAPSGASSFFRAVLQFVLWLAFAGFLSASLPHVAYYFASFEPQQSDGTISSYWWAVAYVIAGGLDITSFLLSLNVAIKQRHATAGLTGVPKLAAGFGVFLSHWPFILFLVAFSWLVNFEYAKQFQSDMLSIADTTKISFLWWSGTLRDLNPLIASSFPVLAIAYTGMADSVRGDKQIQVANIPMVQVTPDKEDAPKAIPVVAESKNVALDVAEESAPDIVAEDVAASEDVAPDVAEKAPRKKGKRDNGMNKKIVDALQEHPDATLRELGDVIGVAHTTVGRRLEKMGITLSAHRDTDKLQAIATEQQTDELEPVLESVDAE